jgi:hypothetical protein
MWAALTSLYVSVIIIAAAFLFAAVDCLEPNSRAALVLKCMMLAAGGAAMPITYCPTGWQPSVWVDEFSTKFAKHLCVKCLWQSWDSLSPLPNAMRVRWLEARDLDLIPPVRIALTETGK